MARKQTVASLLQKYAVEETELVARVEALEQELATAVERLAEVRVIHEALSDAQGIVAPQKAPTKKTPAAKPEGAAEGSSAAGGPVAKASSKRRKKGRRKANAKGVHALRIVDAAMYLAKQKEVEIATAGEVLDWFLEAGYKTRSGTPNRNSVYVSLNREATENSEEGKRLISRPARGKFQFHF